jgi:hypothetical protein
MSNQDRKRAIRNQIRDLNRKLYDLILAESIWTRSEAQGKIEAEILALVESL